LLGAINESKLNKKQEAINNYKNSISANPNQLEIYCKLVYLYNQLNDADNAIYYCCKGLEFYPDNYDLNYNLGILYLMQKNAPQKALEFLEHAKTHNPKNAKLIYLLGVIHIMTDDKITVLDNITELRKLNNPHLANKIEEMMRSLEYNKSNFNVTVVEEEIVDGAINNSEPGNGELPQIHVGDGKTSVNAAGEISIKTKFSKK